MNLRQKYKKAKEKIEFLEHENVRQHFIIHNARETKTLRVSKMIPAIDKDYLLANLSDELSDELAFSLAEQLKNVWKCENTIDPITGNTILSASVQILIPINKEESL